MNNFQVILRNYRYDTGNIIGKIILLRTATASVEDFYTALERAVKHARPQKKAVLWQQGRDATHQSLSSREETYFIPSSEFPTGTARCSTAKHRFL